MSMTRNERRKFEDFMKDAGIQDIDELGVPSLPPPTAEPDTAVVDTRPKKIKECEVPVARLVVPEPKKVRRIQKNAIKEKELKQRCDNNDELQKACSSNVVVPSVESTIFLIKDKQTSEEANVSRSTMLQEEEKKGVMTVNKGIPRGFSFPACVNKSQDKFYGYLGHCSILTKKPVVQGNYYLQVNLLRTGAISEVAKRQVNMSARELGSAYEPAVRVGIAKPSHKLLMPLGGIESYCLQCKNGNILYNKEVIAKATPFEPGDTIGMELRMSPPTPPGKSGRSPQRINDNSCLIFSRNGEEVGRIENIHQGFYVMGVSLYNWANVEFNEGPTFKFNPSNCLTKPYSAIYSEEYLYKDLKFD